MDAHHETCVEYPGQCKMSRWYPAIDDYLFDFLSIQIMPSLKPTKQAFYLHVTPWGFEPAIARLRI